MWKAIDHNDLRGGHLKGYLKKYLTKSGNRIYYSRGIPSELEVDIDIEKDVFGMFYNYGVKAILHDSFLFGAFSDPQDSFFLEENEVQGYTLDNLCRVP